MLEGAGREVTRAPGLLVLFGRLERTLERGRRWLRWQRKRRSGESPELLVELGWRLGDEVMALPVYEALLRRWPGSRIGVRVRYPELLEGNPFVARINPLNPRPDRQLSIKGEVAGESRRATLSRLASVSLAGILPRIYLSAEELEQPVLPELAPAPRAGRPRVVLHPGSTQSCKEWGRARWRELGQGLERAGVQVIEVGLARDPLGVGLSLVGRTGVRELARLLHSADLVVGDDSGPLHVALAVGTRAVGVFGATDPTLLYPDSDALVPMVSPASCRFCWPRRELAWPSGDCPLTRHQCMEAIAVARVRQACLDILEGKVPARA